MTERFLEQARWCSDENVRIAVGRPEVHSLSRVIPKDFEHWYLQLPCLALRIKRNSVENNPACLFVVFLGLLCSWAKHLKRDASSFMWQTGVPTVLHRITIVKLLTQHVVKDDSWVPTSGSPPCWWWGYQSIKTGSKLAAIFPVV